MSKARKNGNAHAFEDGDYPRKHRSSLSCLSLLPVAALVFCSSDGSPTFTHCQSRGVLTVVCITGSGDSFCAHPPATTTVPIAIPRWTHEMEKIEMDASDLIVAVNTSDIERRDVLVQCLSALVKDTGKTKKGLDAITFKYAGTIEQIHALTFYGARSTGWADIFGALSISKPSNRVLLRFLDAMEMISPSVNGLNAQASVLLEELEGLESSISLLHELNHQAILGISSKKSEMLSQTWTTLRRNKAEVNILDKQLDLLEKLAEYRTGARGIVAYAFLTLRSIRDIMEDISLRASDPMLVEGRFPVQVLFTTIHLALTRLTPWLYLQFDSF
ncbi:uncharacterized protein C8R40DRAFT_1178239 [Lentinula edodes]|uniref:uncharacterized protein n=1 Tax=Lentinula edodes TaxID=5353 RepID=UPI001E8E54B7|nr:uncharacterized protein C8R40DRAFT_1178239 [Lentinula edodes]KAH7868119.1 hypothetical protein C8R40DRAFT_1178239 [Lentinula edodes]